MKRDANTTKDVKLHAVGEVLLKNSKKIGGIYISAEFVILKERNYIGYDIIMYYGT